MEKLQRELQRKLHTTAWSQRAIISLVLFSFALVLIGPLYSLFSKAFLSKTGHFVGLENYLLYFNSPSLSISILNTMNISLKSTLVSMVLGFGYAYALTRTNIKGKSFFRYTALIPIFLPTVVHALALVYIFGKQGLLTSLGVQTQLYGEFGIILSEIIYTFPSSFLMFMLALEFADGRLYEVADTFGSSPTTKFFKITLPEIKYTLINVFFVCFTLAFTDFGAPKVLGGNYNVLATDIYKQIAGQFNMNMGAVVGTLLLVPAVLSFVVGRLLNNKNTSTMNAKATELKIKKSLKRDLFFFILCSLITLCFLFMVAVLFMGALSQYYPYDMSFTLKNFSFNMSTGGFSAYLNSLKMSLLTAILGTLFVFIYAYMMEKTKGFSLLKRFGKFMASLPLALPGMVIGLSFIFFFNQQVNPLNFIYGTIIILVLSNILHFFSVPYITITGALKKLDGEFEHVAQSMNIPLWKTMLKVSIPLSLPSILEVFLYYFVNSMVTVSAVVFLYSANFKIASIAITHMEEAGDIAQASAMSLLILAMNVLVRVLYEIAIYIIKKKNQKKEERIILENYQEPKHI